MTRSKGLEEIVQCIDYHKGGIRHACNQTSKQRPKNGLVIGCVVAALGISGKIRGKRKHVRFM